MPAPRKVTEVRAFLGLVGYYRRFIKGCSSRAKALNTPMQKDLRWYLAKEQEAAFHDLRQCLLLPPVPKRPDFEQPFRLQTDWCKDEVAAVLCQDFEGVKHPICYASSSLIPAEKMELCCYFSTWI